MGVPTLHLLIPMIANDRLKYNKPNENLFSYFLSVVNSTDQINRYQRKFLLKGVDGLGLREANKCPPSHRWLDDGTNFLSGKDFLKSVHVRYGVFYNRCRCARGRIKDKSCRRGCGAVETLNHVMQTCYDSHSGRIKRHNELVKYIHRVAQDRGNTAHLEPHFKIDNRLLKPHLVLCTQDSVHAVDIQVINDQYSLQQEHLNKK